MTFSLVLTRTVTFVTKVAWAGGVSTYIGNRYSIKTSYLFATVWKKDGLDLVPRLEVVRGAMGFQGFEQAKG